jgi:hypothetical protein
MIARTTFAATLAVCAIAAPAASAATPDLSQMTLDKADLGSGTTVLAEGSDADAGESYRLFRPARKSGFARLESSVFLNNTRTEAKHLLGATRLLVRDPTFGRTLIKLTAAQLGVKARRVRVGKPRALHVGDGGFTVTIRVNRKTPIVIGLFRLDRAVGEIDARGTRSAGLLTRTRGALRTAADRIRQGLSPQPVSAPTITGTAQVGAALQALPGTWSDATSFAYAWQRCDAAGTCGAIAGATQQTYTVTAADAGSTLRVVVTAANAVGQTTTMSAPTAPVPAP